MTTICLVRHGQTNWNKQTLIQGRLDNKLNEKGLEQAHHVANILKENDPNWDIIMYSPLSRAKTTATIIKETLGFAGPFTANEEIIEREFGEAEGQFITEELYDKIKKDDVVGMEKTIDLQHRSYKAIMNIAAKYPNDKVLLVSHSHFIKGFFTFIDKNITFTSYLPNTSICYVRIDDNKIVDYTFNKEFGK